MIDSFNAFSELSRKFNQSTIESVIVTILEAAHQGDYISESDQKKVYDTLMSKIIKLDDYGIELTVHRLDEITARSEIDN